MQYIHPQSHAFVLRDNLPATAAAVAVAAGDAAPNVGAAAALTPTVVATATLYANQDGNDLPLSNQPSS